MANTFRARVWLEQGEVREAQEKVDAASAIIDQVLSGKYGLVETYDPVIQVRVHMIAGDVEYKKNHYEKALDHYEKADGVSRNYAGEGSDWELYHRRGFALLKRSNADDIEKAKNLFCYVLNRYHNVTIIETIRAKYGMAIINLKKEEKDVARRFAEEALKDLSNALTPDQPHLLLNEIRDFLKGLGEN